MQNVIVRKAVTPTDIKGCSLVDAEMGFTTQNEIFTKSLEDERLFVAELDLKIIGYLRYGYLWDYEVAVIQMIRVASTCRGEGVGKNLVQYLEEQLKNKGIGQLLSSTDEDNIASLKFHQSLNFKECGRLDIYENGLTEIFLNKFFN